ncbi:hypothetical protein BN946_scf184812.g3 [Trametes cinnabarina]|uniref:Uncharacterized protein n=1 Tax=Pycnoporus cinnabarinus TaxID=5643 RepID=A0A060SRA1_PYCCI|nr:hypothetical protein BN946_scf184812.g3 [Trametes cinnabarina]
MTISKTINITGVQGKLGAAVDLTFAFIPSNADFDKVVPIAWKVLTLKDGDFVSYDWTDLIGGCRAIINGNTGEVSPREYCAIPIGRSSDLTKDTSKRPPVYNFSSPASIGGTQARVMNRTKGQVDIGAGFVTNQGQANEAFNPVLVCPQVPDVSSAYVDYDAHLYIWASLDYTESEMLDDSVLSTTSLWDGDLAKLTGKQISIKVSRDKGVVVVDGPKIGGVAQAESFLPTDDAAAQGDGSAALTYKAELAFATPSLVYVGVKAIVEGLLPKGYSFKATTKGYDTDAELEVVLPPNVCCNQAELDLIGAIDASKSIFGKAYIKAHSGAILLATDKGLQTWTDVNPASQQWFGVNPGDHGDGAIEGVAKKGAPAEVANGNGNAAKETYEDDKAGAPADDIVEGGDKFRSIRRGGRRAVGNPAA